MKNIEVSAGGVIVHTSQRGWEVLLIRDMKENWTFPKGIIEEGEDEITAAKREIAEEVGVTELTLLSKLTPILYYFTRGGERVKKTVQYFLFSTHGQELLIPQRSEGISDVRWFLMEEAQNIIGYSETNKSLLSESRENL